jgi:hypothetical protein
VDEVPSAVSARSRARAPPAPHGRQPPTKRAQRRSPEPGTDGQSAGGGISPKIVPISFCFVPLSELDGWMGMDMRGPGSAALPPSRPLARVLAPRR